MLDAGLGQLRRMWVKELGDASVPFPCDVSVIIRTSDAPNLENALHKHFADRETIQKTGNRCPLGWDSSGGYCIKSR